jgi:methyl-accepting chemotaxis protein
VGVPIAQAQAFMTEITRQTGVAVLIIAATTALLYYFALRITIRPVSDLAVVMRAIAGGALNSQVPWARRTDQIGDMARALEQLRDASARGHELEAAAATERARADDEKQAALVHMAEKVEAEMGAALREIGARTAAMAATANTLHGSAGRTGGSAKEAGAAATCALVNAQAVSSGAEQLSAEIRQVSAEIMQSNAVVREAVAAGTEARTTIETLDQKVSEIGAVADMIRSIAMQTNLLALNATIEAARAGDAGKGFAVVASEVKQLATQTARSTDAIAQQIDQVRLATGASGTAVARIEQTITAINGIADAITASIEKQAATATDIVAKILETESAANAVLERTGDVSAEAVKAGHHAITVRDNTTNLADAVQLMRDTVLSVVRTSTAQADTGGVRGVA